MLIPINKVVKQGVVNKGTEHLIKTNLSEKIQAAIIYLPGLASISYNILTDPSYEPVRPILSWALSLMIVSLVIPGAVDGPERPREGSRLSLMIAPEIDRAIALHLVALGSPLVAPLNK